MSEVAPQKPDALKYGGPGLYRPNDVRPIFDKLRAEAKRWGWDGMSCLYVVDSDDEVIGGIAPPTEWRRDYAAR